MKTRNLLIASTLCLAFSAVTYAEEPAQRSYRRKRTSSKAPKVTLKKMNYEQLLEAKNEAVAKNDWYVVIKYLKRMLVVCTNVDMIAEHLIELGDAFVEAQKYAQGVQTYKEFINLYPGHTRIEYVAYRAVVASYNCTHSPDRDQTPTHETIELADAFLVRSAIFDTHKKEVADIRDECYQKLLASELNVCSFYLKQGQENVVQSRLALIEEDFAHDYAPTTQVVQAFRAEVLHESLDAQVVPAAHDTLVVTKNTEQPRAADKF